MIAPGQVFGRLTVLSSAEKDTKSNKRWLCRCSCGQTLVVRHSNLTANMSTSCGCKRRETLSLRKTHGLSNLPEYRAWSGMMYRCYNSKATSYSNYGGRGIEVYAGWLTDPGAFITYIGSRPSPIHSIDRINNDGDYVPGNVRWALPKQQAENRRKFCITVNGETRSVSGWARKLKTSRQAIWHRINAGWQPRDAVSVPIIRSS